jgi:large subunit ribosomal protein L32
MASPKSKISRSRRGMRRAHNALKRSELRTEPTTGDLHRPHRAVKSSDGAYYYKGKQISPSKFEA